MSSDRRASHAFVVLEALEHRRHLTATVEGRAFEDANANGLYDAGEKVRAHENVGLLYAGQITQVVRSDAEGRFTVSTPHAGKHTLYYRRVTPLGLAGFDMRHVDLADGDAKTVNVTLRPSGTLHGVVWGDTNRDGAWNPGEAGIPARVYLDLNGNQKADDPYVVTAGPDGRYRFDDLLPGGYTVRVDDATRGVVAPRLGRHFVNLQPGATSIPLGFPLGPVGGLYGLKGYVFTDDDRDGTLDTNFYMRPLEPLRDGVSVFVDFNRNGVHDAGEPRATTGSPGAGGFVFRALTPGTYHVVAEPPAGEWLTSAVTQVVTVGPGVEPRVNFGLTSDVLLQGQVYHASPFGDVPLANRRIYLDADRDGQFDAGEVVVRTNAQGVFTMGPMPTRMWQVGILDLPPNAGFGDGRARTIYVRATGQVEKVPVRLTGTLAGSAFIDTNANGVRDEGELPAVGQKIYYGYNPYISLLAEATTDANGQWRMENVRPG